ncbi:toll/interleukin-1 receptor domain-containing protein [Ramlibacter sp. WS9]|uniref:toll/interleukin-1 receptor domain-containing protein n=1 Tax=Ramlibacter sp. WS9 TaxID=1882741 RepID=UPI001144684E|nr:toll/interleukin-1 receptor domain-containing protein [Ramlibacter sp. WS9]ROZ78874.1 TIR domain-containing protein [Ramlibacter sp. WS9]
MQVISPPRVFVSYSWDSEEHKRWVLGLAKRLTHNGVNARLDQWHILPGQSLTQFMETEVQACEFVLIVCTREYARKALARAGGVGYEQQIITGNIVAGKPREQFIPIVRDGEFAPGPECSIPGPFMGIYAIDMREGVDADTSAETLLRAVFREPALRPPAMGPRPTFLSPPEDSSLEEDHEEVRLAVQDIDGWHLNSGVASHHRWPETFEIPDEKERRGLVEGDVVKLQFEIQLTYGDGARETLGERMWVIVRERSGPYYIGELNSAPASSIEQKHLRTGDRVVFLPEHVIQIYSRGGEEVHVEPTP